MLKHHVVVGLTFGLALAASGCEIHPRSRRDDGNNANGLNAAQSPAPTVTTPPVAPPAAPPPPAPQAATPAPVKTVVVQAPAAPAKTVFVAVAPAPTPAPESPAVCRSRFTQTCTVECKRRLQPKTLPSQQRVMENMCFAECAREANKRC